MSDEHFPGGHESESQPIGVELHERMRFWTGFFAESAEEEYLNIRDEALNELDGLLEAAGLMEEDCMFNGEAVWTEWVRHVEHTDDPSELEVSYRVYERSGYVEGAEGTCLGFVGRPKPDGGFGLWLTFKGEAIQDPLHATLMNSMEPLVYAKAESLNALMPIGTIEEVFAKQGDAYETLADRLQIISIYSDELNRMLHSRNFRRMRRLDQAAAIDEIIEKAETESDIVEKYLELRPDMAFIGELDDDGIVKYACRDLLGFAVNGVCLGLGMPGREILQEHGIRKNDDLLTENVGLAFMLENEGDIYDGDELVIPDNAILTIPVTGNGVNTHAGMTEDTDTGIVDGTNEGDVA
jgi:hypothetical protein